MKESGYARQLGETFERLSLEGGNRSHFPRYGFTINQHQRERFGGHRGAISHDARQKAHKSALLTLIILLLQHSLHPRNPKFQQNEHLF
jgi:hypothetical protein